MPSRAPHVEALFDVTVTAFELSGPGEVSALLPAEAAVVETAAQRRRAHFAAGRQCARAGLDQLGVPPSPLVPGADRGPVWPAGVVGSIAHTADYAVAVVAAVPMLGVGVDAERVGRVKTDLFGRLFTAAEQDLLAGLPAARREEVATAIFGAKEAFYKAQHPTTRSWVGFGDVAARPVDAGWEFVPATDLAVLSRWRWPVPFRWVVLDGIAVAGLSLRPAR